MRKWMSSVTMGEAGSPLPPGRLTPSPSVYSNISNISRSTSRRGSLYASRNSLTKFCQNSRDPAYDEEVGALQLQINGRSLSVPVPSNMTSLNPLVDQPAPTQTLSMEWVYGYRGRDARHNLHFLPTGELVYFSGCIVVLHNTTEATQRHYVGHTSDVRCLAVHPNRHIMASGQSSRHSPDRKGAVEHRNPVGSPKQLEQQLDAELTQAHIRVWDSITLSTLAIITSSSFEKAVVALSFSVENAGSHLVCVDESFQHTVSVWNWSTKTVLAEAKGANDQVFGCLWHPSIAGLLVLYGKGHFAFWQFDQKTGDLTKHPAVFEGRDKPKSVLCVSFTENGHVVTGDTNGTISLWDPTSFKTILQAHSVHPGGVFSLALSRKGHLLSAGKDKSVAEWDARDLVRTKRPVELPDDSGLPRCIVETDSTRLVVGCSTNTIFEGNFESGFTVWLQGDPEYFSVCVSVPSTLSFATGSRNGGVRLWNCTDHTVDWYKNYEVAVECLSFSEARSLLAIGFASGELAIVNLTTKETVQEQKISEQPVSCVQFSPNSNLLFVAAQDLSAVIYRVETNGRLSKCHRIPSLSSWVVSADWDSDSNWIRANTAASHLHHWSSIGEVVEAATVRDAQWHTCNCHISFEMGCVSHSTTGISSVASSKDVVGVGKDNGTVRIYSNPVTSVIAGYIELAGHGFPVTSLCFPGNQLISVGNSDCSLFQWKIV